MSTSDKYVPLQSTTHTAVENVDSAIKSDGVRVDGKVQEVGCCGDVPKLSKVSNKKRDKLLEWLKSSQLKREENNRQVFSRWIDMVDNGAIDLMSLSNYPGKPSKSVNQFVSTTSSTTNSDVTLSPISQVSSMLSSSTKPQSSSSMKSTSIPTANVCPQYFPQMNTPNFYGISPNWFAANQQAAMYSPMSVSQHQQMGMYPGSYCATSPMLNNYYQYLPVQQPCTMCPSYVMPNFRANMDTNCNVSLDSVNSFTTNESSSTMNIDASKWFEVLKDIKISTPNVISDENDLIVVDVKGCKDES